MNDKFVQITGPFTAFDDIVNYIKKNDDSEILYIKKCGIQSQVSNRIKINDCTFEIGKTGILEFSDVEIKTMYFLQDELKSTKIDCVLEDK